MYGSFAFADSYSDNNAYGSTDSQTDFNPCSDCNPNFSSFPNSNVNTANDLV